MFSISIHVAKPSGHGTVIIVVVAGGGYLEVMTFEVMTKGQGQLFEFIIRGGGGSVLAV